MYDLIFALLIFGAAGLALYAALMAFEIFLFIIYKLDGGRLGLISYFKQL